MPITLIDLFYPYVPKEAGDVVKQVLSTRWIGQAHRVNEFEKAYEQKFNQQYCVSVNSGTSALETAYDLIGIKEGDEVIVPVMTCTATNLPLLARKAKLVFVDIDPDTMCPNNSDVLNKITENTKAIVTVDLGGISGELKGLPKHIPVVQDAAQAPGIFYGDYVCNSFQAIKHFTTGDGGMITCPNKESYDRAKLLRWFGIDREKKIENNWQCYKERQMTFDIEEVGYKRHMNDIQAGMGIIGLYHYDNIIRHRGILFNRYKELLKDCKDIKIIDGDKNVYWLCTALVERRDDFSKMLFSYGIDNNLVHLRNDIYKVFGGERLDLPVMNEYESKYICLPLHMNMNIEHVDFICEKIRKGW